MTSAGPSSGSLFSTLGAAEFRTRAAASLRETTKRYLAKLSASAERGRAAFRSPLASRG